MVGRLRAGARGVPAWLGATVGPVLLVLFVFLLGSAVAGSAALGEGGLASAVALAATALLGCSALLARSAPPVPPNRIRTAIRDRERRTAFLPQRDPDASGRARPRAPGRPSLTAA
ncbi:DUF6412 domain-containing protein [Streptomyces sp. NPDC012888]|uniref:DUF6412 domain-containing protein n=1 Tax=Streptomyces sp. NPDC012888 TaxID=3364855 RepID=UPI003687935F